MNFLQHEAMIGKREEVTSKENAAGLLLFLPVGSGESGDSVRVVRVVRVETLFDGC